MSSTTTAAAVVAAPAPVVDKRFARVKNQFLVAIIVNIETFSAGCCIGWFSPALPLLRSPESPLLDGPVSQDMAGWIGAFFAIGGFFGCLFFGLLGNVIGYKRSMLLTSIPMLGAWMLIIFGQYAWQLCVARFLNGSVAGASFACVPMFIAEIASDFVRGKLNSYIQIAAFGGIMIGFIGGSYIPFHINPWVMLVAPIAFVPLFLLFPDSPQQWLKKNNSSEAEKSLRFYRNCRSSGDAALETSLQTELDKFQKIAKQTASGPPIVLSDFLTPQALRAMSISPFLMAVNQFSGSFAISNYAETIFKETGSDIDPQMSAIVMAGVQVLGTYVGAQLMDRTGRKVLLLVSLVGSIVALMVTGAFVYLAQHGVDVSAFTWVPLAFISLFIFMVSIGILPAPYVMLAEVIPAKIRRIGATVCTCVVFISQAIMLRLMPLLIETLQLWGSMWLFAAVCVAGLVFTIFVVTETKGVNLDVLVESRTAEKTSPAAEDK